MEMEFLVSSLRVMLMTQIIEEYMMKKWLDWLLELEEDRLLVGFN